MTPKVSKRKKKGVHYASMVNGFGDVSPLCAKVPKALDLGRETWNNRKEAVSCKKCLAALLRGRQ